MDELESRLKAAHVLHNQGRNDRAAREYNDLAGAFRRAGDEKRRSVCCHMDGISLRTMGDMQYRRTLDFALQLYYKAGDLAGQGNVIRDVALGYLQEGNPSLALNFLTKSEKLLQEVGEASGIGVTLAKKAVMLMKLERLDEARACLDEAFSILDREQHPFRWGTAMMHLAELEMAHGRYGHASDAFRRARQVYQPDDVFVYRTVELLGLQACCSAQRSCMSGDVAAGAGIIKATALMQKYDWPAQEIKMMLDRIKVVETSTFMETLHLNL